MKLELHDSEAGETGNSLFSRANDIDHDYQAEQWVTGTTAETEVVKWILSDTQGIRCVWERPEGSSSVPEITQRSVRFEGTWEKGPKEIRI